MQITVLGATGGIGAAIVSELTDRGHHVIAASRSVEQAKLPTGAVACPTDLHDTQAARAACEGSEVVVMAAQVPYSRWQQELPALVDAAVDAAEHAQARLVMVDNLYAYGAPGTPISETTPESATTVKGRLRASIGQRLLNAHREGRVRVTIGRFSDYYGPGGGNSLAHGVAFDRAHAGKAPRLYLAGDVPHVFAYLPDTARAFATLIEHPEADGKVWVLPAAEAITQRELFTMIARERGITRPLGMISPLMLRLVGLFNPDLREARELAEQFERPWLTDSSAFESAFGAFTATPHADAVAATLRWYDDVAEQAAKPQA